MRYWHHGHNYLSCVLIVTFGHDLDLVSPPLEWMSMKFSYLNERFMYMKNHR